MNEMWKDIPNFYGKYQVSNMGNVRSIARTIIRRNGRKQQIESKMLVSRKSGCGYLYVTLHNEGKKETIRVHRLVASLFLKNPNNLPVVNHKDENKQNNNVDNLEWCTQQYNIMYSKNIMTALSPISAT